MVNIVIIAVELWLHVCFTYMTSGDTYTIYQVPPFISWSQPVEAPSFGLIRLQGTWGYDAHQQLVLVEAYLVRSVTKSSMPPAGIEPATYW